jgi:hypothetical protein
LRRSARAGQLRIAQWDIRRAAEVGEPSQPRVSPAPPQPWADLPTALEIAMRPNAVIKVRGACTLSREPYPFPDIWDPLARVFDAWRLDRCLWGTEWTRAFAVVNYEQAVSPSLRLAA